MMIAIIALLGILVVEIYYALVLLTDIANELEFLKFKLEKEKRDG